MTTADGTTRAAFIEHLGRRVLCLDVRGAGAPESIEAMGHASRLAAAAGPRSVLMLVDIRGAGLAPLMGEEVYAAVTRDRPYVRALAVVGVDGERRAVFNVAAAVLGDAVEHFGTPEEALAWLVTR